MSGHIQSILASLVCTMILMSSAPTADAFLFEEDSTEYVAQVKVFLDYTAKANWKSETGKLSDGQLRADIQTVFDQMNIIFGRMKQYKLNLQLELKDVVTVKHYDMVLKGVRDYKVEGAKGVYDFRDWISNRYYKHEFDIALLFTGNDIYTGGSYLTYGVAAGYGVVCSAKGVAVVEMFGKIPTDQKLSNIARYTAHEIGHVLGAQHNDDEPLCSKQKGYLMAAQAHLEGPNIFNITQCTAKTISAVMKNMTKHGVNCLLPDFSELTAADEACQDREGSDKWFMSRNYKEYGDTMCGNLKCITWNGQKRVFTQGKPAPDGLGCGTQKTCQQGKCVDAENGDPNMSDECPWGNQDLRKIGYRNSCEGQNCDRGWQNYCCAHCSALEKELELAQG